METELFAEQIRMNALKTLNNLGFGHYSGSLSIVETLAVLYNEKMAIDIANPKKAERDYFVLSKGHAGPALYATLFVKGFIDEAELMSLNQNGTNLPSHPDKNKTTGVDMTTGSLGQGISAATGIAFGNKLSGLSNYTYCIVGDGEMNEGQCWEALQFASHRKLDHLIIFIDDNKKQLDGFTKDICNPLDFVTKMQAFGLASERIDGSDCEAISEAIDRAKQNDVTTVIVLDTVKGQGVKLIEEIKDNHHLRPDQDLLDAIKDEVTTLEQSIIKKLGGQ